MVKTLATSRDSLQTPGKAYLPRIIQKWPLIAPLLLLLLAGLLFVPVLSGYWLADDFYWVRDFAHYPWRDTAQLFLGDWSRATAHEYRPLWAVSFALDLGIWGVDPVALHITNILFHMVASALVWYVTATMSGANSLSALLSLAFFVLAPVHAEPVAWISARGHIMAAIFILSTVILFRRYQRFGSRSNYLASIGAAVAAFVTQEAALALPALLLLRDFTEVSRPNWRWLKRTAALHAPFWILLGIYLVFRVVIFAELGREGLPTSVQDLLRRSYISVRTLWLSPTHDVPTIMGETEGKLFLVVLVSVLLIGPLLLLGKRRLDSYARGFIYFAVGWPIITTTVYMGSHSQRHLYLASIGTAVALGWAGEHLLTTRRLSAGFGVSVITLLLVIYSSALISGVAAFARNGEWSFQIMQEVNAALAAASRETDATVLIIPEMPNNKRVLWDYFYPAALEPPFRESIPSIDVIPSFASCHCPLQEWMTWHAAKLERVTRNGAGPVYVVEWSNQQAAFVTRVFDRSEFQKLDYLEPDGSFPIGK